MADSFVGIGTITQGDREAHVRCDYRVTQDYPAGPEGPPGLLSWTGGYSLLGDLSTELEPGDATITLEDGREAPILINSVSAGTGHGRFVGNGRPPS